MSLEFYSTKELIKELFSRETFLGTLIYLDKDFKRSYNTPTPMPTKGLRVITSPCIKGTKIPATWMRWTADCLDG